MTPNTMDRLIEFCMDKLPEKDLLRLDEIAAKCVPPKQLAADAAIKRRAMLALDCQIRRQSGATGRDAATLAADAAERDATIAAVLPNHGRLKDDFSVGYSAPMPHKPRRSMTATERREAAKMFPGMFKGD